MKNNISKRFKEIMSGNEEQAAPEKEKQIAPERQRTDTAATLFSAGLMVAAIICFIALFISLIAVGSGEENAWLHALIFMCGGIALLFLRWVIGVFSQIHLVLLSIDDKLGNLISKTED